MYNLHAVSSFQLSVFVHVFLHSSAAGRSNSPDSSQEDVLDPGMGGFWHLAFELCCSNAVFSAFTALLPLTGIWYLISFQNLKDGERDGKICFSCSPFSPSTWCLKHFLPLWLLFWFFHQHTAPCFFLRWRIDSGKSAHWSGLISSSSTRTTWKAGSKLDQGSLSGTELLVCEPPDRRIPRKEWKKRSYQLISSWLMSSSWIVCNMVAKSKQQQQKDSLNASFWSSTPKVRGQEMRSKKNELNCWILLNWDAVLA